jgi:DNA-binding MarR family transcriptional regulator
MPDLETRIANRLQEMKSGQTPEQLANYCGVPIALVLKELKKLEGMGHVQVSGSVTGGVWTLSGR